MGAGGGSSSGSGASSGAGPGRGDSVHVAGPGGDPAAAELRRTGGRGSALGTDDELAPPAPEGATG